MQFFFFLYFFTSSLFVSISDKLQFLPRDLMILFFFKTLFCFRKAYFKLPGSQFSDLILWCSFSSAGPCLFLCLPASSYFLLKWAQSLSPFKKMEWLTGNLFCAVKEDFLVLLCPNCKVAWWRNLRDCHLFLTLEIESTFICFPLQTRMWQWWQRKLDNIQHTQSWTKKKK